MNKDGTGNPMIIERCKTAGSIQKNTNFPIIVSGADTKKVGISEAEYMKEYLIQNNNINKNVIIMEEKADNTVENAINCLQIIQKITKESASFESPIRVIVIIIAISQSTKYIYI